MGIETNMGISIVRMSSWRGQTTLSGEWIECDYESKMVIEFLEGVKEIMLSIISE